MVSLREHIKLLHFQTTKYSVHKASDTFLSRYDELFDKFWEVSQSNKYRILLSGSTNITLCNTRSYDDLQPLLQGVTEQLQSVTDLALAAIRDEILGEISQFSYLMTFV